MVAKVWVKRLQRGLNGKRAVADSRAIKVAKLSNLLSIEPRAYDPATAEMPREEQYVDDDGKLRVRLRNQNTVRWRARVQPDGSTVRESNARCGSLAWHASFAIGGCARPSRRSKRALLLCEPRFPCASLALHTADVCAQRNRRSCDDTLPADGAARALLISRARPPAVLPAGRLRPPPRAGARRFIQWSDGSLQLQVGEEVLDVAEHNIANDHSFLYLRHRQLIQARAGPYPKPILVALPCPRHRQLIQARGGRKRCMLSVA